MHRALEGRPKIIRVSRRYAARADVWHRIVFARLDVFPVLAMDCVRLDGLDAIRSGTKVVHCCMAATNISLVIGRRQRPTEE